MYWKEVDKFGGSSVGDAESLGRTTDIIISRKNKRPIVVLSAFGRPIGTDLTKATDLLRKMEEALFEGDFTEAERLRQEFSDRAKEIIASRGLEGVVDYAYSKSTRREYIFEKLDELFSYYRALHSDKREELARIAKNQASRNYMKDQFMSLGEPLTAGIGAADLIKNGHPAKAIHSGEIGLVTDSNYQNANPVPSAVLDMRRWFARLQSMSRGSWIPVLAGYVGMNDKGESTTLGRGASDYTAAIVGHALECPVIIWTDVDGIKDGTPGIIQNPSTLGRISFDEAYELAAHGTTAIHYRAVEEAKSGGQPMFVRNTFNPEHSGTRITTNRIETPGIIKALTAAPNVTYMEASCSFEQVSEVLSHLHSSGIEVPLMSYTGHKATLVLGIPEAPDALTRKLKEFGVAGSKLRLVRNQYLIKIVGDGIGDQRNYMVRLGVESALQSIAAAESVTYGNTTLHPIQIVNPSSIGFVTSRKAGPAIAQALYDALIANRAA